MTQNSKKILGVIICSLILLLGLGYLIIADKNKKPEGIWIYTEGPESIREITLQNPSNTFELQITQKKNEWLGSDGSTYDKEEMAIYTATLGYMKVEQKIEAKDEQRKKYGLDRSAYTIQIKDNEGKEFSYMLGDEANQQGYYLATGENNTIYLIDSIRGNALKKMVHTLYDVTLTNVKFDEIRGVRLYRPQSGEITLNRSEAPRANGDFYWNMYKPYGWGAKSDTIEELIDTVEKYSILKRTDEALTLKSCGFDKKEKNQYSMSFYDAYDQELTLYFGDTKGDDVYCRTPSLEGIYLIDHQVFDYLHMDIKEFLDQTLYYYEVPSVELCRISWREKIYELKAKWLRNRKTNSRKGQRYFLDNDLLSGAVYSSLTHWFENTKIVDITNNTTKNTTPLGSIEISRLSTPYEQTLTFYPVEEDSSLILVDFGIPTAVYIEKKDMEQFVETLEFTLK